MFCWIRSSAPITKAVKGTNQKLLEESRTSTKALDDLNKKIPMITAPRATDALKSITAPEPKLSISNARATEIMTKKIKEEKNSDRIDTKKMN